MGKQKVMKERSINMKPSYGHDVVFPVIIQTGPFLRNQLKLTQQNINNKLKRLNSKFYFLTLVKGKTIFSSGWIYFGSKWKISEIDRSVSLNKKFLLFDFETPKKYRNKGYYQLLLKLIRNKFLKKKLAIYSFSTNKKSKRAIYKSGFKFIKKIHGLRN